MKAGYTPSIRETVIVTTQGNRIGTCDWYSHDYCTTQPMYQIIFKTGGYLWCYRNELAYADPDLYEENVSWWAA